MRRFLPLLAILAAFLAAPVVPALAAGADQSFTPQLAPAIPPSKEDILGAVWVIVIFVLMVAVLYPTAWKQVLAGLKAREQRIRKDISDAEAARLKAEETLKQYSAQLATAEQKVRDLLTQAGADAEKIATNIRMKATQEAEEAKTRATAEIEAAKRTALTEIYEKTADLATSIAEKIIKRNLNAADQRDLVDQSLQQLPKIGRN